MNHFFIILICAFAFCSCGEKGLIFTDIKALKDEIWQEKDTLKFDLNIKDTISFFKTNLIFQNTRDYSFSNIYVLVDVKFPNAKTRRDTLSVELCNKYGEWHGEVAGRLIEHQIPLYKNVRFPQKGHYRIKISHLMRQKQLKGVGFVGINTYKTTN